MSSTSSLKGIQGAAAAALQIQDACNPSGVIHAFSKVLDDLWVEAERLGKGTDFIRHHPVVVLFVNKLEDMVGSNVGTRFSRAYRACEELATGRGDAAELQQSVVSKEG